MRAGAQWHNAAALCATCGENPFTLNLPFICQGEKHPTFLFCPYLSVGKPSLYKGQGRNSSAFLPNGYEEPSAPLFLRSSISHPIKSMPFLPLSLPFFLLHTGRKFVSIYSVTLLIFRATYGKANTTRCTAPLSF